jgi:GT2 family glycosyltransferase
MTIPLECTVVMPLGSVDHEARMQVQAVLAQRDAPAFELVLALNTTESSQAQQLADLVSELADPRVRIVHALDRRGASYARNTGAASAAAPILVFCDADDIAEPEWLAALLDALAGHGAVGGTLVDDMMGDEQQAGWRPPATPDGLPTFMGAPYIVSASMAITRAAFEQVGGFDETLTRCEDIAISFALLAAGHTLGFAPAARMHYRQRSGLRAMLRQHYFYGRGMSQVLMRYGVPSATGAERLTGWALLRPNAQPGAAPRSIASLARRAAIAAGRTHGVISERRRASRGGRRRSAVPA